jgi:hypothetical protein
MNVLSDFFPHCCSHLHSLISSPLLSFYPLSQKCTKTVEENTGSVHDLIIYTSHTVAEHYGEKILNGGAYKAALPTLLILTGLQPTYEGQLVMSTNSVEVFYVINGLRHYCTEEDLSQRGLDMSKIKTISLTQLEKLPLV